METSSGFSTDALRRLLVSLGSPSCAVDDADRIDRLRLFEQMKAAIAAAQAAEAVALDRSRRLAEAAVGIAPAQQGRGVAGEVGLALRMSPYRAQRWLGWAKIVTTELPATFAELRAGRVTEWRATLVARETAALSRAHRAVVDARLAPQLEGWGDRRVETETRTLAYRLDPAAAVDRARNAVGDRQVSCRPAPDTMCRLSALVPVAQGVAAYAALSRAADTGCATGDPRSRGQLMADTLIERLTGQTAASDVPVEINLVMTDQTLLGRSDEPARITGHGPVPAGLARDLALQGDSARWVRRLFTRPGTGELMTMDTHRREFTGNHRRFLRLRDNVCRTPWCDAPVRHADHVTANSRGGRTHVGNGQGLCEACNYRKQLAGWATRAGPGTSITTIAPTGHEYAGRPPDPPGRHRAVEMRWHRVA